MDGTECGYFVEPGNLDLLAVELDDDEPVAMSFGRQRVVDPRRHERIFGCLAVPSLDRSHLGRALLCCR